MIQIISFIIFIFILLVNVLPGFYLYSLLHKKFGKSKNSNNKENNYKNNIINTYHWHETIIYSVLLSFAMNILFLQILKFLKITVEPFIPLLYLIIFALLSKRNFSVMKFEKVKKYEKYTYVLFIVYFLVFSSFLMFGYTGNKYGDFVNHLNNLKSTVEEKQLNSNYHYFYFEAESKYPKGFTSILALPLLMFQQDDALIIAQVLTLFSRIIPLLFAFLVFTAAMMFAKSDKAGFYAALFFLALDINILLPIYWGGLPTNLTRLLMFAVFLLLWKSLEEKFSFFPYVFMASLLSVTALAIRPDIIVYFPIMLISIIVFYVLFNINNKNLLKNFFKIIASYGIVTIALSLLLYFNYILLYYSVLAESTNVAHQALATGLLNWRRFIPLLPFIIVAIPSLRKKELWPLLGLALGFFIIVPIVMSLNLMYISHHIFTTFTLPLSVFCGATIVDFLKKKKFKKYIYAFFVFISLLFVAVNVRQHYLVDVPLQEKELTPIYWIRDNVENNARFFYLYEKGDYYKNDLSLTTYYGAKNLQQLIAPYAEKTALTMVSSYSFQVRDVHDLFGNIAESIDNGTLSPENFHDFLKKNNFTHIFLTKEQFEQYHDYFERYKVIYDNSEFIVLKIGWVDIEIS